MRGRRRRRRRRRPVGGQRPARARGPRRGGRRDAGDRQPGRRRHAAGGDGSRCRYEAARRRCSLLLVLAGCGETEVVREPGVQRLRRAERARPPRARRCPTARCGSRSSPTARRRASSGRSSATASTPPRAGSTCSSTTSRPTSLSVERMSAADRPGGRDQAGRARRLDPRARPRAGDPARGQGRHPGRLDQLRQRRLPAPRRARPRRPGRGPRGAGGRAAARRRGRAAARCASTSRSATPASTRAAAAWRRRCARSAGARGCCRSSTTTRARPSRIARAVDGRRRRRRARHQLARRARRRPRALAGTGVKIGTFDLGPDVLKAVEAGEIGFAVDQQAYLQGYLPIEMLALRARYGIFPSAGRRRRHGPELRHPRRRRAGAGAERALDPLGGAGSASRLLGGSVASRRT